MPIVASAIAVAVMLAQFGAPPGSSRATACRAAKESVSRHCALIMAAEAYRACDPLPDKEMLACHAAYERFAESVMDACRALEQQAQSICYP